MMTFPAILFGFVLASLYGIAFHIWRGGKLWRLLLYTFLSIAGFWIGQAAGSSLKWHFAAVGPLNAGMGTLGSILILFFGYWLSLVKVRRK